MKLQLKSFLLMIFFCFCYITSNGQQNIDKELLDAYLSKDSSNYFFKKAYSKLKSKSDTASYLYFKFFQKDKLNENDSATFYAKRLIPIFQKLDTINRLRKVHERLYYQHLHLGNYENALKEIQEAINNSIKYAEASKISVLISEEDNQLSIIIKDNGIGFDIKTVDLGNGLSNMEKRISEIDGRVGIISEANKGTTIRIICKL